MEFPERARTVHSRGSQPMKKHLKNLVFAVAATLAVTAPVAAQQTLQAGSECTYFPFNFRDNDGVLKGYDIDVGNEVGKRLNVKIEWVCQKWDGMLPALLANKFDLIVASMSVTEERRQRIDFSESYRISVGQFVGAKNKALKLFNADKTPNADAFKGVRVGLQRATTYDNWIQAKVPGATVVRYDTVEQLYLELRSGRVDVIMTNPMKTHLEFLS
ncbi:MAG: transporter substrate-binding domain-containing protein, partial [Alphaproteobacteria bacterium]|nr:transporter substrate-binding domain-containing protein [Alphaproteobacteria bacterium]